MQASGALIWDGLLFIFFIVCLFEAFKIPKGLTLGMAAKEVGSALWPQILLVVLVVLAGLQLWSDVKKARRRAVNGEEEEEMKELRPGGLLRVAGFALLSVAYVMGQRVTGFLVACFVMTAGTLALMGYRNRLLLILASAVIALGLTILFGKGLFTPLPKGVGFFRTISSLVY